MERSARPDVSSRAPPLSCCTTTVLVDFPLDISVGIPRYEESHFDTDGSVRFDDAFRYRRYNIDTAASLPPTPATDLTPCLPPTPATDLTQGVRLHNKLRWQSHGAR